MIISFILIPQPFIFSRLPTVFPDLLTAFPTQVISFSSEFNLGLVYDPFAFLPTCNFYMCLKKKIYIPYLETPCQVATHLAFLISTQYLI